MKYDLFIEIKNRFEYEIILIYKYSLTYLIKK